GGSGADTLNGGAGTDTADFRSLGGASFNLAAGTSGGSSANDVFISIECFLGSTTGGDNITGGNRKEHIVGYGGNDALNGGGNNDNIQGGAGADLLQGGAGNDAVTGGKGAAQFIFSDALWGDDRILDFKDGVDLLSFASVAADSLADFAIAGNDTAQVTLTLGSNH